MRWMKRLLTVVYTCWAQLAMLWWAQGTAKAVRCRQCLRNDAGVSITHSDSTPCSLDICLARQKIARSREEIIATTTFFACLCGRVVVDCYFYAYFAILTYLKYSSAELYTNVKLR